MPKSKRAKIVTLSRAKKLTRDDKEEQMETVRKAVDSFKHLYIFEVRNMRNSPMKAIRADWTNKGKFILGRLRVTAKALGITPESAYRKGLETIATRLEGEVGLFFTNEDHDSVLEYFDSKREMDYVRSGNVVTEEVIIEAGALSVEGETMPHSINSQLQKLGMPSRLEKGIPTLDQDYVICRAGRKVNSNQSQLLKLFKIKLAEFQVRLSYRWDAESETCIALSEAGAELGPAVPATGKRARAKPAERHVNKRKVSAAAELNDMEASELSDEEDDDSVVQEDIEIESD